MGENNQWYGYLTVIPSQFRLAQIKPLLYHSGRSEDSWVSLRGSHEPSRILLGAPGRRERT